MKLFACELVIFLLVVVLAMLPDRISGRSALYRLATFLASGLVFFASLLPAAASVIEEIPQRFHREWKIEQALIGVSGIERERAEL